MTSLVEAVLDIIHPTPVFIVGSAVAAEEAGLPNAFDDIDVFCPSAESLMVAATRLQLEGYAPQDHRVLLRWQRYGIGNFHTNSLKLDAPNMPVVNLVYKKQGGHPLRSLTQVIESFDFGLLAQGWSVATKQYLDLRLSYFPDLEVDWPLPLMPSKRADWSQGFIGRYDSMRQFGRYAKYHNYGYDMSAVKPDLLACYESLADYHSGKLSNDSAAAATIYSMVAGHIERDEFDMLTKASQSLEYSSTFEQILESL